MLVLTLSSLNDWVWLKVLNDWVFIPDNLIWKFKAPSQVKAFVWNAVLNRINTNDLLQIWRSKAALSLNICVMCMKSLYSYQFVITLSAC